jgi:hypothetical protein
MYACCLGAGAWRGGSRSRCTPDGIAVAIAFEAQIDPESVAICHCSDPLNIGSLSPSGRSTSEGEGRLLTPQRT